MGKSTTGKITMNDTIKDLCLIKELETARNLIISGFGELQEIQMANDFYHLPQQLIASGFERLLKCYICLVYEARNDKYPSQSFLKNNFGHDLLKLKKAFADDYANANSRPLLFDDIAYVKNDPILEKIVYVLSEFGKQARYYNLDIVTGSQKRLIDPSSEWEILEREIEDPLPYMSMNSSEALYRDYYPMVNSLIIMKLERFFRTIAMQFTLGNHGGKLRQMSSLIQDFITLSNEEMGRIDYRRSVKRLQQSKCKWNQRTADEVRAGPWPSTNISKDKFKGDWPFRTNTVVIECRENLFCIVNIEGYDFSLNGAANSKFSYPSPHDAGIAIIGKSIGPFIDMALSLRSKK